MRIGVDYRWLSGGISLVRRGMGRYTQQQVREVVRRDHLNEYVLFCLPDADLSLITPEVRLAPNVVISTISVAERRLHHDPHQPEHILRYSEEYQNWIFRQNIDLYHATTTFAWNDIIVPHFDACPVVWTFYDAIPLVYPDQYLANSRIAELSLRLLSVVQKANRLIAISESARRDAIAYLGYPADQIDVAYPIADPVFRILAPGIAQRNLQALRQRVGLPITYAMSVTHLHHSKNLETLLVAYARLAPALRQQLPLVLTCHFADDEVEVVRALARDHGIAENVIITGFVSEDEMVALYNCATMVVHPSRYEGFGLPVVEALCCGAPVITTTAASLPEVGGDAAVLVGPDDLQGFADAIEALYLDPERRAGMRERGIEHAQKFSADQLGRNTLDCYTKAVNVSSTTVRQHIALWAPLPPQKTGIADYSAELIEHIEPIYDLEIFVDDGYLPDQYFLSRYVVQHYTAFERRNTQRGFDTSVYQLGNSFFHLYMYRPLQQWPGIVMVHDLAWINVLYAHYSRSGRMADFKRELLEMEGSAALREYDRLEREGCDAPTLLDFFSKHHMLHRVVECSPMLLVQSDLERDDLRNTYAIDRVHTLEMGVADPWEGLPVFKNDIIREQFGLRASTFVAGIFGLIQRFKRLDVCLRAFQQLYAVYPDAYLWIVGDNPDIVYQQELDALVQNLGINGRVFFTGRADVTEFELRLLACDAIINLRYPSMKQISAIILRAVAAGKPLIISDIPEWQFVPETFSRKVVPDRLEVDGVAHALIELARNPGLRQTMAQSARRYFEQGFTIQDMANRYQTVIQQLIGAPALAPRGTADTDMQPRQPLPLNKVSAIEDLADPEIQAIARELALAEPLVWANVDKYWPSIMGLRSLRRFAALGPDSVILAIGSGAGSTPLYLTTQAKQVFSIDVYLNPQAWQGHSPDFMLTDPGKLAPYAFNPKRLVTQHMDARILHYCDNEFDGIFIENAIEYAGSFELAANLAYELGRVLKPGGVLALSTKWRIQAPPGGQGWEGCLLFSQADVQRFIIEASGLELVDELQTDLSTQTLAINRLLPAHSLHPDVPSSGTGQYLRAGDVERPKSQGPVRIHAGYVYCTIHLTLRKTNRYPAAEHTWAQPTQATIDAVRDDAQAGRNFDRPTVSLQFNTTKKATMTPHNLESLTKIRNLFQAWDGVRIRGWYNTTLRHLPIGLGKAGRTVVRVMQLGRIFDAQAHLYNALIDHQTQLDARVQELSGGASFEELSAHIAQLQSNHQAAIDRRIAEFGAMLTALEAQSKHMLDQLAAMRDNTAVQAQLQDQLQTLQAQIAEQQAHQVNIFAHQTTLTDQINYNTSYIRLIQQQLALRQPEALEQVLQRLASADLVHLLQVLEQELPMLAQAGSIELSIQDVNAEALLVAGVAYFGGRMSSSADVYRIPTDAWYHVDFTTDWNRRTLFESAATRLKAGGAFILITLPEHTEPFTIERLVLADNSIRSLVSTQQVRVYIWQAT